MNIFGFNILVQVLLVHYVSGLLNDTYNESDLERVLSRRKRFIVFPEGSSFQLGKMVTLFIRVICLTCLRPAPTEGV